MCATGMMNGICTDCGYSDFDGFNPECKGHVSFENCEVCNPQAACSVVAMSNGDKLVEAHCECGAVVRAVVSFDAGEPAGFDGSRPIPPNYYVSALVHVGSARCTVTKAALEACAIALASAVVVEC